MLVTGLADSSCYSFKARNFPGHYLRHASDRIRKDARDGSALFDQDATFCAQAGLSGSGVSFESLNYPGRYIRHHNAELPQAGEEERSVTRPQVGAEEASVAPEAVLPPPAQPHQQGGHRQRGPGLDGPGSRRSPAHAQG